MLAIHEMAVDKFVDAILSAEEMGVLEQFKGQLKYLVEYGQNETLAVLYPDFADKSFAFNMCMIKRSSQGANFEAEFWFNGGLIFHPGETGPDESFSVELNSGSKPHWSTHT